MDKICVLTQELLPLYVEGACSPAAADAVAAHVEACADCRERLAVLRAPLPGETGLPGGAGEKPVRPAAPFVRLWRRAVVRAVAGVLIFVLAAAALLLTVCTVQGDGYTWFTLPAYITAERLADAAVDKDPVRLGSCIAFTGVGPGDELEIRTRLLSLEKEGVFLLDGWSELRRCAADDGIQELSVFFTVDVNGEVYTVEFPGSLWEIFKGKAALQYPLVKDSRGQYGYTEQAWVQSLQEALCTHNPG